jgi:hypothetical protein
MLGVCDEILHAYHSAMSFGHVIHAQYGIICIGYSLATYVDESLAAVNTRTRCFVEEMRQYDVVSCLMFLLPLWQTVSFLANPVSSFVSLPCLTISSQHSLI